MSTIHCPQSLNHVQAGNSNKADNTAANFSLCGRWNRAFRLHSLRSGKIEVLDFHHQGSAANGDSDVIMWYRACVRGGVTLKGDWSIPPQVLLKISNAHETEWTGRYCLVVEGNGICWSRWYCGWWATTTEIHSQPTRWRKSSGKWDSNRIIIILYIHLESGAEIYESTFKNWDSVSVSSPPTIISPYNEISSRPSAVDVAAL